MLSNLWRFILTMGLLLAVVVIAPPLIEQTMQAGALAPSPELEAAGSEIQHWTNVLAVILAPLALALLVILRLRSNHSGAGTSGRLHGRHPSVDDSAAPGRITHDQSRSRKVRGSPALMRTAAIAEDTSRTMEPDGLATDMGSDGQEPTWVPHEDPSEITFEQPPFLHRGAESPPARRARQASTKWSTGRSNEGNSQDDRQTVGTARDKAAI